MASKRENKCCSIEPNFFPKIIAVPGPVSPPEKGVLGYGSLIGDTIEQPTVIGPSVPFNEVGPLSKNISASASGNELVVNESGVYQITVSMSAEATAVPDPTQRFLTVSILVNGVPIFDDTLIAFNISNRSSSTFVVQARLNAGDSVGVRATTDTFPFGYISRSLTLVQLSN
ncbi:hypothetical protein ACIQ2D_18940 [Lysinibacillus sp. NPDC097287]|uniref:hypothetical protein n=1 Tax=Lysinibacillus sp. NPDC097287 TaxID=3364144 RepID=UPI00382D0207